MVGCSEKISMDSQLGSPTPVSKAAITKYYKPSEWLKTPEMYSLTVGQSWFLLKVEKNLLYVSPLTSGGSQ